MDKQTIAANLKNKVDDEMSKAGVYSKGIDGMIAANDFKNSLGEENEIDEKWSKKYKDSIDCKNPKGFSQKAHCQGKNKKTETDESTGSGSAGGFSAPLFSTTKKEMQEKCWPGYQQKGMKKKDGRMVPNCVNESVKEKEKEKKYLDIEDMIPELRKQLNKGTRLDKDRKKDEENEATGVSSSGSSSSGQDSTPSAWAKSTNKKDWDGKSKTRIPGGEFVEGSKKVEATEATGSGSSGQYSTTAAWAKSTSKKDWMGKSKPQIPGGKFVQVKKKCKKFPYCNQGDIKALKIYENDTVKKAIKNISEKHNISENVIKSIISYEYEKLKSNK